MSCNQFISWNNVDHNISLSICSINYGTKSDVIMSAMASHWRLHYLLNRLFRRKSKKTQSSASLAFVRGLQRWLLDSPYGFPLQRATNAENFSIWWHHHVLCFQAWDRNVFGICSSPTWTVPPVSWQGVDVRNQRYEYPKMSDALHTWNTFSRFYVRYSSCVSLIPVS